MFSLERSPSCPPTFLYPLSSQAASSAKGPHFPSHGTPGAKSCAIRGREALRDDRSNRAARCFAAKARYLLAKVSPTDFTAPSPLNRVSIRGRTSPSRRIPSAPPISLSLANSIFHSRATRARNSYLRSSCWLNPSRYHVAK